MENNQFVVTILIKDEISKKSRALDFLFDDKLSAELFMADADSGTIWGKKENILYVSKVSKLQEKRVG